MKKIWERAVALLLVMCMMGVMPAYGSDAQMIAAGNDAETTVPVTLIQWNWDVTAVLADTSKEYSFADKFKVYPENADVRTATLTCSPEGALEIDNENKTFKANLVSSDKLVVTLTLTADGASAQCQSATKQITVYNDIPLKSIHWDYQVGSTGKSLLKYYETINGTQQPAEYYYEYGEGEHLVRKYHTDPLFAVDYCKIKVTSSDQRVIRIDEPTKRVIPVGNGEAKVTITATTPEGVTKSDSIILVVKDSPYTPVRTLDIGYDPDWTDSDAEYDKDSNTIKLGYQHSIKLTALVNEGAKPDQKAITLTMSDGRKVRIVDAVIVTWKSSDENVAIVDQNGNVKVTGYDTATITLTVEDNGEIFTKEIKISCALSMRDRILRIAMLQVKFIIYVLTFRWRKAKDTLNKIIHELAELYAHQPRGPM